MRYSLALPALAALAAAQTDVTPIAPSDIAYLQASGADFCTSYISYTPSSETAHVYTIPTVSVTVTTTVAPTTITVTGDVAWKRDGSPDATSAPTGDSTTVGSVAKHSAVILAQVQLPTPTGNGTTAASLARRDVIPTPASITDWPPYKISAACSSVATGCTTVTTSTYTIEVVTSTTTATETGSVPTTCVVPIEDPSTFAWHSIFGQWDDSLGQPGPNPYVSYYSVTTLQLPFEMCMFGCCDDVIMLETDGTISFKDVELGIYSGLGDGLYMYQGWNDGLFYRISGPVGFREVVFAWYASTFNWGHQTSHFTATYFENKPNEIQYKYYDAVQAAPYGTLASVYVENAGEYKDIIPYGDTVQTGTQYTIITAPNDTATILSSTETEHDVVDCCTKAGWHSCTEFSGIEDLP